MSMADSQLGLYLLGKMARMHSPDIQGSNWRVKCLQALWSQPKTGTTLKLKLLSWNDKSKEHSCNYPDLMLDSIT